MKLIITIGWTMLLCGFFTDTVPSADHGVPGFIAGWGIITIMLAGTVSVFTQEKEPPRG